MRFRALTIGALAPVVVVLGCGGGASEAGAGGAESAAAERRVFATTVAAIGTIKPQIGAEVRVGSRISGRVRRLGANIGDVVRRGQVIAELETEELDAIVAERRAELAVWEAAVAAALSTTQLAAAELARHQQLEQQGVATRAEADVARERHGVAVAQQGSATAALARARAALDQATVQRSFATLRAPITGVVASVATQEGETIAAGLNAPTFLTILDLARLQVDTYVDEVDIGRVQVGQRATFTVDAFPARDFGGIVAAIYPTATIQDNVVKYIAAVRIDSAAGVLRPEMTANVRIELAAREVLAVPVRAVRRVDGRSVVYVGAPGRAEERSVRVGWRDGGWIEISEGLQAGERVVLDPQAPEVRR
ncbi:MAG TPA: efflux RND transporter periplasmic adaptor subunit [Gemmatimonadaceae bacterium]|nr:efflux RND transporter periplasmic adaptor subunit [Gemmatimonadaceae bacterium]